MCGFSVGQRGWLNSESLVLGLRRIWSRIFVDKVIVAGLVVEGGGGGGILGMVLRHSSKRNGWVSG